MLALYETQQEILGILHTHLVGTPAESTPSGGPNQAEDDEVTALPPAPTRARHRKTVLLVDDDAQSLRAAKEALEHAQIPVVCVSDGDAALAAIAAEKPDLIALEGEMGGALTGRDLVDRVMASMEWINIPIVLYTRAPLESQDEARTTYSADAYVLKGPQGPTALVSQVITTFRKR
jgi:CheY-like chemotaxis protein